MVGKAIQSDRRFWILVFIGALLLRLAMTHAFVGLGAKPDAAANTDQVDYEEFAAQLAEGNGYCLKEGEPSARRPPGTSFLLLPVYVIFGRDLALGRLWWCLLSAATCVLAGTLTTSAFGRNAGRWAAVLIATYPGHFYYTMHFLSEPPFGLWTLGYCAAAIKAFRDPRRRMTMSLVAGACLGFAVLTRPQAIFMLPIGAALLGLVPALRRREVWLPAFIQALVVIGLLLPWLVRNHHAVGKPTISTIGGYTFWGAHNAVIDAKPERRGSWMPLDKLIDEEHPVEGDEVECEKATWKYGLDFLRENPDRIPGLLAMKLVQLGSPFRDTPNKAVYWTFAIAWIVVAPLFLWGLILAARRHPGVTTILLLPLGATIATALVFYGSTRFRDSVCVIFLIFAAVALAAIQDRLISRKMAA